MKNIKTHSENLIKVLASRELLRNKISGEIKISEPVIKQVDNALIFPNTINVIQGQAGVNKSRLAEFICASFLSQNQTKNELLGFQRFNVNAKYTVVYVDTERNLSEQFPFALQSIISKAGYSKIHHPESFEYISLLQINRSNRFDALKEFLEHIRKSTNNPLFVVLDVSTDCIEDFNKTDKSMELIDLMNMSINEYNVIFLCIIHENPRSEKARGHFGTELMNKASLVIQVGFEKDANQKDTDLIRVKYLKCRSTAKHASFHIKYSEVAKGLVLANEDDIKSLHNSRKLKASYEDVIKHLEVYLGAGFSLRKSDLLKNLKKELEASSRTLEDRLNNIMSMNYNLINELGENCQLIKETIRGSVNYRLISKGKQ